MRKHNVLLAALVCGSVLVLTSLARAEVKINNLSLEKNGEFVTVKVFGSQAFEFTHATEEAKGGKPFRVFMDCQNAFWGMAQNNFYNLPSRTVKALRCSQYQETPQKIVRVVLDCTRPVTYKVQKQSNWVEISIASGSEPSFAKWEAVQSSTPSLANVNQPSTQLTPASTPDQAKVVAKQPLAENKIQKSSLALPEVKVQTEKPKTDLAKKTEPTKIENAKAPRPEMASKNPQTKPTAQPAVTQKAEAKPAKSVGPAQEKRTSEPALVTENRTFEPKPATTSPATNQATPPVLTQTPAPVKPDSKSLVLVQKPETDQWAGYPKRETVKYNSQGRRDPFSPLVNKIEDFEFGVAPVPSIENLNLVGILESFNQNLALLEDTRGFGYILQAGDKIKEGRVLRVDPDQVVFQVSEYGWTRNVTLELYNQSK